MSLELIGWHDEDSLDHRRRMRNAMLVSVALHGSIFAAFAISPPRPVAPMPQVLAVELIAGPMASASASPPKPAPRPKAPEPPAPAPPAPAAPAPPVAKAPVQVLPEESPGRIQEAKPAPAEPKEVARVEPKPAPTPTRPVREKELSYDAAMAELGLDETEEFLEALPGAKKAETSTAEAAPTPGAEVSQAGAQISAELAAWNLATRRRIQSKWVTPPDFRGRGLATSLVLELSASGDLIGPPTVEVSSGDPYFDDNAVRAVLSVAPLPPPPEPGRRIFLFRSEAN